MRPETSFDSEVRHASSASELPGIKQPRYPAIQGTALSNMLETGYIYVSITLILSAGELIVVWTTKDHLLLTLLAGLANIPHRTAECIQHPVASYLITLYQVASRRHNP